MKRVFYIVSVLVLLASCKEQEVVNPNLIDYVTKAIADSSSVVKSAFEGYNPNDRFGTVAIVGSASTADSLASYLVECDMVDNVNGKKAHDGLTDFAGETFDVYADETISDYSKYVTKGLGEELREKTVRAVVEVVSADCHVQISDNVLPKVMKKRPKMIVLTSSYAHLAEDDIQTLMRHFGKNVTVICPCGALVRAAMENYDEGMVVGIWEEKPLITAGVYPQVFAKMAPRARFTEIATDRLGGVREQVFAYLDAYIASGEAAKLSCILMDNQMSRAEVLAVNEVLAQIHSSDDLRVKQYSRVVSDGCVAIDAYSAVASLCYHELRNGHRFTHIIARPQCSQYRIVPAENGEVKCFEVNDIY